MRKNIQIEEWKIIEDYFNPENNEVSESIFSLANGKMGHRANFEEFYSGRTLQGNYIAGIYYPDKFKDRHQNYFYNDNVYKIINAPDWRGLKITVGKNKLDVFTCKIHEFKRVLNMKHAYFFKQFVAEMPDGKKVKIESYRFLSIVNDEVGAIKYSITPLNFSDEISILIDIDADVSNKDSNYGEKFWNEVDKSFVPFPYIVAETKKSFFNLCTAINYSFEQDGEDVKSSKFMSYEHEKYIGYKFSLDVEQNKTLTVYKYAAVTSSLNYSKDSLIEHAFAHLENVSEKGFDVLFDEHKSAWEDKWQNSDIIIKGDDIAQQAIRYNIFNLLQTYSGKDERLSIGPKGLTGEKYGGLTYWNTEIFCLPFYLSNYEANVAKKLLKYRYNHLKKAIENAEKIGFKDGAALFPMATINGQECYNEWETTFEEIHRNGAIAYSIYNYVNYTGDVEYLQDFGLETLISISRFWQQRINFSEDKQKFVLLGVTGPNQYENNVNNNWYTSSIALWTLKFTIDVVNLVKTRFFDAFKRVCVAYSFDENEIENWQKIIDNMYLPYNEHKEIFVQQDGYLDKEIIPVEKLDRKDLPLNQNWSWDKILRSCYIKQADVVQGLFLLENQFDNDTIKRNFDFYEPLTVHESSLSACIHSIVASKVKNYKKAVEYFNKTSRLDLDDLNRDTKDGLHITSMAGTWMSLVYGFGGMRVKDGKIYFNPFLPIKWNSYTFNVVFRKHKLEVTVTKGEVAIKNNSDTEIDLIVYDNEYTVLPDDELNIVGI